MIPLIELHNAFGHIEFYEKGHKYVGKHNKPISVTGLKKNYVKPFRKKYQATLKVIRKYYPNTKSDYSIHVKQDYYLIYKQEVPTLIHVDDAYKQYKDEVDNLIQQWKGKSDNSLSLGSAIHKRLELAANGVYDGITKQEQKVIDYFKEISDIPVKCELNVGCDNLGLYGQLDRLSIRKNEELKTWEFGLSDYKTDDEINTSNHWEKMLYPLDDLDKCNFNEYTIQLNLYRYLIESKTSIKISFMEIIQLPKTTENINVVSIPYYDVNPLLDYHFKQEEEYEI